MEYGITILQQCAIMFIMLVIGFACYKGKWISQSGSKQLSSLVLNLANPLLVFLSYQTDFHAELLSGMLYSLLFSVISYALCIFFAYLVLPNKAGANARIERFSVIYSNCGFIGIPLVSGIFGTEGVLYLNSYITMFTLLCWSHGVMMMKGQRDFRSMKRYSLRLLSLRLH